MCCFFFLFFLHFFTVNLCKVSCTNDDLLPYLQLEEYQVKILKLLFENLFLLSISFVLMFFSLLQMTEKLMKTMTLKWSIQILLRNTCQVKLELVIVILIQLLRPGISEDCRTSFFWLTQLILFVSLVSSHSFN